MEVVTSEMAGVQLHPTAATAILPTHRTRYGTVIRGTAGVLCGVIAGILLVNSIQVGVAFGVGETLSDWDVLLWGHHWMWRAAASLAATAASAFVGGMIARRKGRLIGAFSAIPTALYWFLVAYMGWAGTVPGTSISVDVPIGYQIIAVILILATLPLAMAMGKEGAAYGHANAEHFDARRVAVLGVKWYHFLWSPILIHLMVLTAAFGSVYGFQWLLAVWRSGMSPVGFIPTIFAIAMFGTLRLLVIGAGQSYQALAGFKDPAGHSTARRVLKFGFGYTLATMLAQLVISLVHSGLARIVEKIIG